jgi:hypothetical protein
VLTACSDAGGWRWVTHTTKKLLKTHTNKQRSPQIVTDTLCYHDSRRPCHAAVAHKPPQQQAALRHGSRDACSFFHTRQATRSPAACC